MLAWEPPGGDLVSRHGPGTTVMVETWQNLAREKMLTALADVFGKAGPGVAMHALVARGTPGPALVEIADRDSDVLVVGAGRRSLWHRACSRSVSRYCLTHATCPVFAVPPSPLEPNSQRPTVATSWDSAWTRAAWTRRCSGSRRAV